MNEIILTFQSHDPKSLTTIDRFFTAKQDEHGQLLINANQPIDAKSTCAPNAAAESN